MDGAWVRTVEFRQAVGGYDRDHVDEVLEKVAQAIDGGWSPKPIIRDVHFRRTRWKGYHRQDIDEFIELLRTSGRFSFLAEPSFPSQRSVTGESSARDTRGLLMGKPREQKNRERAARGEPREGAPGEVEGVSGRCPEPTSGVDGQQIPRRRTSSTQSVLRHHWRPRTTEAGHGGTRPRSSSPAPATSSNATAGRRGHAEPK